jgi:hypothetical protein
MGNDQRINLNDQSINLILSLATHNKNNLFHFLLFLKTWIEPGFYFISEGKERQYYQQKTCTLKFTAMQAF